MNSVSVASRRAKAQANKPRNKKVATKTKKNNNNDKLKTTNWRHTVASVIVLDAKRGVWIGVATFIVALLQV